MYVQQSGKLIPDECTQVVDESEMLVYESELREWERKEEEKKHHFTITESCDAGDKHSPVKATKVREVILIEWFIRCTIYPIQTIGNHSYVYTYTNAGSVGTVVEGIPLINNELVHCRRVYSGHNS